MPLLLRATARLHPRLLVSRMHTTAPASAPRKPDTDSPPPRTSDTAQSRPDPEEEAARLDKTAYTPGGDTGPEAARHRAQRETSGADDPLEFTGANHELSKPRGDEGSRRDAAPGKDGRRSSGGKPSRNGKP
ncbi:hypothetical protein A9K55_005202 [Cordyceps militaris]|uniref:Uncharacterized protein n=1 Tax=Cordyceps militaris TaxID=73501 RepID=A0A2H4SP50_CORMI|nr:hypothetical protein A9K55_005202 [Cordyceps militaris]